MVQNIPEPQTFLLPLKARPSSVLLCGYYGERNLGDDLLLEILINSIDNRVNLLITTNQHFMPVDLSRNVKYVNRRNPIAVFNSINNVDTLILGGGNLLQDKTSYRSLLYYLAVIFYAKFRGVKIILWAQGLGPLQRRISVFLVQKAICCASSISLRDQKSFELYKSWNINIPVICAPDPTWQLPRKEWIGGESIVICWRPTNVIDNYKWKKLFIALDYFQTHLNRPVVWMSFDRKMDEPFFNYLCQHELIPKRLFTKTITLNATSFDKATCCFQKATIVLPMRLHAYILAKLCGAPTCALSYDPKVSAASAYLNSNCIDLEASFDVDQLIKVWHETLSIPTDIEGVNHLALKSLSHNYFLEDKLFSSI
ncbi:polysaccharide pyruvyl transferase CsaB [Prochlorococcus sp. MIT 1341]|uniref:polysaccharide pyruvyl transferase CsaB n=1 Tax=Prochlorococcus sp. MIT 1341 TaxID=3096221 RepID=UPI002A75CA6F|nr:polysaccharide pyruvyl transferase CsaB [Prochlorococcus sp. MIT 1341]